ncbi:DUF3592 domain-containing protein [Marinobacter salinexigens]|uniref:DUF3592 domain-containing protein n=1 Tax=Marinobacter salinexigens TaxID=2919747 RepID=UPI00165FCFBD|nr:DUF3592 domain-containing protein [Marinobacter salinexigens]
MAEKKKNRKSHLGIIVFGLLFALPGLGILLAGPAHTLYTHFSTANWTRVAVTLDQVNLITSTSDDSDTYSIKASYRYQFNGRSYSGSRVSYDWGSDNIGDFHQNTLQKLRSAQARGQVTAWINPDNPTESYLVRDLRWKKLLFASVFGSVFSVAGLFVIYMGTRKRSSVEDFRATDEIASSEKHGFWAFAFMAFMFLGISAPAVIAIPGELDDGNWPILAVLLFPLVGLWLARMAWVSRRNWLYYGPTPLTLDPAPGQVGGDIAGHIRLSREVSDAGWNVTLQCIRVRITQGKNSRRSESVIWQMDQVPELITRTGGSALAFRFEPPTNLPATDEDGRDQVTWRLVLKGPTKPVPLERTFEVPVVEGTQRSSISLSQPHVEHHERMGKIEALTDAAEQIDVEMSARGMVLTSRIGRNMTMKMMLLLFGLIFGGASVFLAYTAATEGFMLYIMALVFGLFGFPMLLGGLFMLGRSLKVTISSSQVEAIRYWCGIALWKRSGMLVNPGQIELVGGSSMTSGNRTIEYFSLAFRDGNKKIRLAEGIAGRPVAEAFRDNLIKLLGLH